MAIEDLIMVHVPARHNVGCKAFVGLLQKRPHNEFVTWENSLQHVQRVHVKSAISAAFAREKFFSTSLRRAMGNTFRGRRRERSTTICSASARLSSEK